MEGRTIDGAIRWATRGGGKVYSVTRKGIRWITHVKQVAEEIQRASGVSRNGLREAVRKGTRGHMQGLGMIGEVQSGISHPVEQSEVEAELGEYWDDVTGVPLKQDLVMRARKEEMKEFTKHGVYTKVPEKRNAGRQRERDLLESDGWM